MEIRIDTNDILGDEDTIRDEVIAEVSSALRKHIIATSQQTIQEAINLALTETIKARVKEIIDLHLDTEYTVADEYGRNKETSTIRKNIADIIQKQCVFKAQRYSSDRNAFSDAVISTMEDELKKFRKEFDSTVNSMLIKECLDSATKRLKEACGIKP